MPFYHLSNNHTANNETNSTNSTVYIILIYMHSVFDYKFILRILPYETIVQRPTPISEPVTISNQKFFFNKIK